MQKVKMTKRDMKNFTATTLEVGYCELQNITNLLNAVGYNSGVYGWNCDLLLVDDHTSIITGYNPTGNTKPTKQMMKELKALSLDKYKGTYDQQRKKVIKAIVRIINKYKEV